MITRRGSVLFGILASVALVLSASAEKEEKKAAAVEENATKATEKVTVIFYRTRSAKGGAIRLNISGGNDGNVGALSNGSKIVKTMPAGEYTFTISSPSIAGRDTLTLKTEVGKTYYIKCTAKLGWPAARSTFKLMDEKQGKAESDKIK